MVHLRVQGGKAAEMPEVPVFRHLVKISRPAQPVQYADVEGCLTFPELDVFSISRYRARSGDMSHSTAGLHPRRMSARRNSALAGMKRHRSSGVNILPHSRAFSTSLALSVLK